MRGAARSGGGQLGNFYVGCEHYLLTETDTAWDVEAGISFGALDAAFHAMYPKQAKRKAAEDAVALFSSIRNKDIWRHRFPLRRLHGLWLSSFYDSKPLQKKVRKLLDVTRLRESGKKLIVGAYNRDEARYQVFTEQDDEIVDAVLASASFPGAFQPIRIHGDQYVDGGVHTITPIKSLIDAGCDEIDVFICHPRRAEAAPRAHLTGLENALYAVEVMSSRLMWMDVLRAQDQNELIEAGRREGKVVKFRVFHPDSKVGEDPLDFSPAAAKRMQFEGYETARRIVEQPWPQ